MRLRLFIQFDVYINVIIITTPQGVKRHHSKQNEIHFVLYC